MAWQVAIVVDAQTSLHDIQVLLGQMPVWALDTPERRTVIRQLNAEAPTWDPDPAFTVFTGFCPDDPIAEIVNLIPTVEEHHSHLSTLRFLGIDASDSLTEDLAEVVYQPLSSKNYPGIAFAKPLDRIAEVAEIQLDANNWQSSDDFYKAFFAAVGAPSWQGHNFDALNDSIATGNINEIEVPYRISIRNACSMNNDVVAFLQMLASLIRRLQSDGCPIGLVVEQA